MNEELKNKIRDMVLNGGRRMCWKLGEIHMPVVARGISKVIRNVIQDAADTHWPANDVCYLPEEPPFASGIRRKFGID